jgi:inosose dehydratase
METAMNSYHSRRKFLQTASAAAAVAFTHRSFAAPHPSPIRFGYAAMTWGDEERQAIQDIADVGYSGIQFRVNAVSEFKPAELRDLLAQHRQTFVALSSGEVSLEKSAEEEIAKHLANAQYVKECGGLYLQVLDQLKAYPRTVTADECSRLGKVLTELGKRTADIGIQLGYHNHVNTISEHPENLDRVLDASDPKYVHLELDTAHVAAGGGDPKATIERWHDRILFLHLKDYIDVPMTSKMKYPFEWVELGRGKVNLPTVFAALHRFNYSGWAVVELDRVPHGSRSARDCAITSRDYLTRVIGVKI